MLWVPGGVKCGLWVGSEYACFRAGFPGNGARPPRRCSSLGPVNDSPDPTPAPVSGSPEPSARQTIFGAQEERILARLAALDPGLMTYVRDFAYDTVYERPGLDLKTKELVACALLTSLGSPPELRTHLRGALRAGATEQEVRETLLLCVPYLGFPRVVGAFEQLRGLLEGKEKAPHPEGQGAGEGGAQ